MFRLIKNKFNCISLLILTSFISIYIGYSFSDFTTFKPNTALGFLIDKNCSADAEEYFLKLDEKKGFEVTLNKVHYTRGVFPYINYYGQISHAKMNLKELEGYVNGAMEKCGSSSEVSFDLAEDNSLRAFSSYIDMRNKSNIGPIYLRLDGATIIVSSK